MTKDYLTVRDLVDFVLLNRGTTTFMNMDEPRIAELLRNGIEAGSLFYSVNPDNQLTGMILAEIDEERQVLFVTENLSMTLSNLKAFARRAKQQWPNLKLEAIRHGSHRHFNTSKLYSKLT